MPGCIIYLLAVISDKKEWQYDVILSSGVKIKLMNYYLLPNCATMADVDEYAVERCIE